ncbi:MAG TPA: hypothetical protein VNA04_14655 [Thermoanaerobaculia bacterium]|nr:hypothetical protein [Thermoanaerobaculia bacterium]
MKRVLLMTVHFRNAAEVGAFAANAAALQVPEGWRVDVAVVDNSGGLPPHPGVSIYPAPANLGYLGGAALGLDRWRAEQHGEVPEWVGIVNPDVALAGDAIAALLTAGLPESVAIVAPSVLLGGTIPQNPFLQRRPSSFRMWLYTVVFRSALLTLLLDLLLSLKRFRARRRSAGGPRPIYAAHGSAVLIRRSFFERGGTLSYRGFMYGEEIHLAEQVRSMGGTVMYMPSIAAVHRGSSSTSAVRFSKRRQWHLQSAQALWSDYFRSRPPGGNR